VTGPRLEIGRVGRAHGLRGEVWVSLVTNRAERMAPGAHVYTGDRELVVEAARRQQDRWIVSFAGVADRDAAEQLRNEVLVADALDLPGELWVHELIGAGVRTADGRDLGTVAAVEANPAHDLLVLDDGTLVPVVFVVEQTDGQVVVEVPDGLLEL
jgi:16S rRNA processing protein RimM